MTTPSSSSEVPQFDFDALYRGESPAEGVPAMPTPPWDTKAPKENVVVWQNAGTCQLEQSEGDFRRFASAIHQVACDV